MNDIRVLREYTQTIAATPEQLFPLLCPVREADYLPGWKYRLVYSRSGLAELGCVFTTPNETGPETTWIITKHDLAKRVAFAWVRPEMIMARLLFTLKPSAAGTEMAARYEYTALTDAGAAELAGYTDTWFAAKMQRFGACLEHYLRTGSQLAG
jgi:hypothetical protein